MADNISRQAARLVLPDALTPEQREVFDSYKRWLPPGGVCVNVLIGPNDWDLRPLLLEQGRVWLYRFSPELPDATRNHLIADLEGFAVIPHWSMRVVALPNSSRFLTVRPFFQATVSDQIRSGELDSPDDRLRVAQGIIEQVGSLMRRNLVHGHVSLKNACVVDGRVVFMDPRLAMLANLRDEFTAPELSPTHEPESTVDMYGLGRCLKLLMAASLDEDQQGLVDQLLLPSARQRPAFATVREAFSGSPVRSESAPAASARAAGAIGSGRLINRSGAQSSASQSMDPGPEAKRRPRDTPSIKLPELPRAKAIKYGAAGLAIIIASLTILHVKYPATYYELAHTVPFLASDRNADYEAAWMSGEKNKMREVARAAVVFREPAAENTIVTDVMNGSKPQNVNVAMMRQAFDSLWFDELSRRDVRAVLALTLQPLVPEGVIDLPRLDTLHPAVILAVASQVRSREPVPQLKAVPVKALAELPEPVGPIFDALADLGVATMGDPEAIGLASIVSGTPSPEAIEAYIGTSSGDEDPQKLAAELPRTLARLALVLPIIGNNEAVAKDLAAALRDRSPALGQAVGWFDIEELAKWDKVSAVTKLRLVLGKFPSEKLTLEQYADLLLFPLPDIRKEAARVLSEVLPKNLGNMITFLSGDQNRFTREQNVALLAAMPLKPETGVSFLSATWFKLNPDPDAVILLLISRSNLPSDDVYNLEFARYLKKVEWQAPTEILRLLSRHPEPLVRSLAYSRLDPSVPEQLAALKERAVNEKDEMLRKSVQQRLDMQRPAAPQSASAAPNAETPRRAAPTAKPTTPAEPRQTIVPPLQPEG